MADFQKTILFSPAVYILAETTRCLEIAKICREYFKTLFISYGGEFESLIEKQDFMIIRLEPRITREKTNHLYAVDHGRKLGSLFTRPEVETQVAHELTLFNKVRPAAVVTGFNFSNNISCRVAIILTN